MALKRTYTFEEGEGLNLRRLTPSEAGSHDALLAPAGLSNWQLAALYVIGVEESATASEIGFALVMDRQTVAENLRPLEACKALRKLPVRAGRRDAFALTERGRRLLAHGVELWRSAHRTVEDGEAKRDSAARGLSVAADKTVKSFA